MCVCSLVNVNYIFKMETDVVQQIKWLFFSKHSKLKRMWVGLLISVLFIPARAQQANCPIGFSESPSGNCYKVKSNETFDQKYDLCSGNEVTIDFYIEYKFLATELGKNLFWTDYVRAYSDGPFINWRIGDDHMGELMEKNLLDSFYITHPGMCSLIDLSSGLVQPIECNEGHSRLCVVKQYSNSDIAQWNCPNGYLPFMNPIPTCLKAASESSVARRVAVRATWGQSSTICEKISGYLPHRGYIYMNHNEFGNTVDQEWPLGIEMVDGLPVWTNYSLWPPYIDTVEWNFANEIDKNANGYVTLSNEKWKLSSTSKVFNRVICEYFVDLPILFIQYISTDDDMITFGGVVNQIEAEYVKCFTDANLYYPERVQVINKSINRIGVLTVGNGFYWCAITNTMVSGPVTNNLSRKVLFIKDRESLRDFRAVLLRIDGVFKDDFRTEEVFEYLKNELLKNRIPKRNSTRSAGRGKRKRETKDTEDFVVKAIYDDLTVLIHVRADLLNSESRSENINIIYIKNLLFCTENDFLPETDLGNSLHFQKNCSIYTCAGNFNTGAEWTMTVDPECNLTEANNESTVPIKTTINNNHDTTDTTKITTNTEFRTTHITQTTNQPTTTIPTTTTLETTTTTTSEISTTTTQTITEISSTTSYPTETTPNQGNTTDNIHTTPTPEDQVNNVVNEIEDILKGPVNSSNLATAANLINSVLSLNDGVMIPPQILKDLDTMVDKMTLPENETHVAIVQPKLAIMVTDRMGDNPITGIKVSSTTDGFNNDSLQALTPASVIDETEKNDIIVNISSNLGGDPNLRLSFIVFWNDRAFNPTSNDTKKLNTKVLSITLRNTTHLQNGEYVDINLRPNHNHNENETKVCAYWDFHYGDWSTDGCELLRSSDHRDLDTCRCYHLTHFAQLITSNSNNFSELDSNILTIISFVGCSLSLIGLIFIFLTGILFRSWRNEFINKVWLHLSGAVGIMILTFLCTAFVDFSNYSSMYCIITGVALHYSVLASFCWMFIAAGLSYQRLVTVFTKSSSHRLLKASLFGWFLPIIPIAILLAVDSGSYSEHFGDNYKSIEFCYPGGLNFWLTVFLPVIVIIICNTVLFTFIIYSVFIRAKVKRHGDNKQLFRSVTVGFLLFYLFGLTWVFGLLSKYLPMAYLFCITATLQGVVLCIFFVIGNKKARELWLIKLHIREANKIPVTTSISRSYPSKGSQSSRPMQGIIFDTDSTTKPRSLMINSDSSFS